MRISSWSRVARRVITAAFATTLALLFLPATSASAAASSVHITGGVLVFDAADATKNGANILGSVASFIVTDTAGVTAGENCTQDTSRRATCEGAVTAFELNLGDENDTLLVNSSKPATINAGPGNDSVTGGSGADTVNGGDGNDTLNGGLGTDVVNGGPGTDTATYTGRSLPLNVSLDGVANDGQASENDNVKVDVENVTTGGTNDTLVGSDLANVLSGGGGTDSLNGGDGNDSLNGGTGNDTIVGGPGVDAVSYAGATTDVNVSLDGVANDGASGESDNIDATVENITGGTHDDTLIGSAGANTLDGGPGDDVLDGRGGADALIGGLGIDTVSYADASFGSVTAAIGGAGPDGDSIAVDVENLIGGNGNDDLTGNEKANRLEGGPGDDALKGGSGNDVLEGGDGGDTMNGGLGIDLVDYSGEVTGINATIGAGGPGGDTIAGNVENMTGGSGSDTLTGSDAANVLNGGDGDDALNGGLGNDKLNGGLGNDTLNGAGGRDTLNGDFGSDAISGGPGVDVATYTERRVISTTVDQTADVFVTLDGVADDGELGEGDNVASTVENVVGGAGNDTIEGTPGSNQFNGGAGDDTLRGFEGKDALFGEAGDDLIFGGPQADQVSGGSGNDDIRIGGDGTVVDLATCGTGNDTVNADPADQVSATCETVT